MKRVAAVLAVALALAGIAWAYSQKYGGQLSGLIGLSRHFSDPEKRQGMFLWGREGGSGLEGYDGQFFFELAHDPFHRNVRRASFDNLPYRSQRMLFPLLVYVASGGGRTRWVPLAMAFVNVMAIVFTAWMMMGLAIHFRKPWWWGLVPLATAGVVWPF